MIAPLLLAATAPTAIDAERAFATDGQRTGQWAAEVPNNDVPPP